MTDHTPEALRQKKCLPCEGGVETVTPQLAADYLKATPEWTIAEDNRSISRKTSCRNFVSAMQLLNQIAAIAESQQHHPDLHLTGYRHVRIDLTTHAIGGLSENDFILAANIDPLLSD